MDGAATHPARRCSARGAACASPTRRRRRSPRTSSRPFTRPRCRSWRRWAWTSSSPKPAPSTKPPAQRSSPAASACASTVRWSWDAVATAPERFTLHARNPAHDLGIGGDEIVFGCVSSPPNCSRPRGRQAAGQPSDFRNLLRPQPEPERHPLHRRLPGRARGRPPRRPPPRVPARHGGRSPTSPGTPTPWAGPDPRRHRDRADRAWHRPRAAGTRAVAAHRHQHELALAPRRADGGRDHRHGAGRAGGDPHPLHAGRGDGAGDPGRRPRPAERRGPGRDRPDPAGPQRGARGLWRLHLQRRHEVRGTRLRHAGIHEGGARRRSAGPPLPPPLPLLHVNAGQRGGRPVGLRIDVLALGRRHERLHVVKHAAGWLEAGSWPRSRSW